MTQFEFTSSEELKKRMVQKIIYDNDPHVITIKYKHKSIRVFTYPEYLDKTMKIFDEQVNGIMNQETKELTKATIIEEWDKYIFNNKDTRNGNADGNGEAEKEKQTKAELVLNVVERHNVKLFVDDYKVPHAGIQRALINNVVNDIRGRSTITGEVKDIQTLFPSGHQIVRVVNVARNVFNSFRFPDPNKSDILLSEFQRAQNHNLLVRVNYNPLEREKDNLIKSIEVLGVGWKD